MKYSDSTPLHFPHLLSLVNQRVRQRETSLHQLAQDLAPGFPDVSYVGLALNAENRLVTEGLCAKLEIALLLLVRTIICRLKSVLEKLTTI